MGGYCIFASTYSIDENNQIVLKVTCT